MIVGAGPAGESAVRRLAGHGLRIAIVERELVGGECPYWACVPSKTLLRPPEVRLEARRVPGLREPEQVWHEVRDYRDHMISGLDDSEKASALERDGAELIRGAAQLTAPGQVVVGRRTLQTERILIAVGTEAEIPPVEGLAGSECWTNRELLTMDEVPASAVVLGGGPVGVESAQLLRRHGAEVTVVEPAERLLARESPRVGELLAERLAEEGITIRLGVTAKAVDRVGARYELLLDDGTRVHADRIVFAAGRRPRTSGLALEAVGIEPAEDGSIGVDDQCRAAEGIWAAGDVTAIAPFTHVAHYQGRIVADVILGRQPSAEYRAIPRVVFGDPEIAAVGLTSDEAADAGIDTVEGRVDLERLARTGTFGRDYRGEMRVLADRERRILVGAWAVGPLASEWIGAAVVAIKARVPIATLRDMPMQFPTFGEAISYAVDDLDLEAQGRR